MNNLPIITAKDFNRLWAHSDRALSNGHVVDDATLDVMLRIEKTMQRLKVMGDDDRRILWIRIKAPVRGRMSEVDTEGFYWCQFLTAHYRNFHYLLLDNPTWSGFLDLRSAPNTSEKRENGQGINLEKELLRLEEYVNALVENICSNPDEYNAYVEANLPYSQREGRIRRSDLNRILPTYRTFDNPRHVIDVLNHNNSQPIWYSDTMTLRIYMRVWRIAYNAYRTAMDSSNIWETDENKNQSDLEVFMQHNSKGHEVEGLDLDSELDFTKWYEENSMYHCHDVAYARIHLSVSRKGKWSEGVDVPDNACFFTLSYSVYGYSAGFVTILEALLNAGYNVKVSNADRLRRIAEETDFVGITLNPNKYAHDETVGNEIHLPDRCRRRIIKAAEWYPQPKVGPLSDE